MTCDDSAFDSSDSDDFQRWYFGGSPPESDGWDRHAFEEALHGVPPLPRRFEHAPTSAPSTGGCVFVAENRDRSVAAA